MFIIVENFFIKLDKLLPIYLDFYGPLLENEVSSVKISSKDKILHIGCGPIPATSIYIVKKTEAVVTAIDKNLQYVKKAQLLISKLKLFDKIHVLHSNALDFPLEKFDLIIMSLGIKSYENVIKHISKNMRSDARLIVRTSSSINGDLTEKDMFLKDIFKIEKIIPQKQNGLMLSVLLIKK